MIISRRKQEALFREAYEKARVELESKFYEQERQRQLASEVSELRSEVRRLRRKIEKQEEPTESCDCDTCTACY